MKYTEETTLVVGISDKAASDYFQETPFYIAATDSPSRPRRTLKHNDTFVVVDTHGDIGASAGGPDGLFHSDTRFVSLLGLSLNGIQPLLLGSNVRDDNSSLTVDLTNPDMYFDNHLVLPKDTLHIVRTIFLWRDTAYQRLAFRNHGDRAVDLRLTLLFDSDFADLFEVRGLRRPARGKLRREIVKPNAVALTYEGLDGKTRQSRFDFDPVPETISTTTAGYHLTLGPKQAGLIALSVGCGDPEPPKPVAFIRGLLSMHREQRQASLGTATVVTSNEVFNQVLCRSMADLYMLKTDTPQGPYPYAGIPWYSTTFGRDGLITALQMLWFDPSIARGVFRRRIGLPAR
jgi:glycogen debranching enzyme